MRSQWILIFVLSLAVSRAFPQSTGQARPHAYWNGFGVYEGLKPFSPLGKNCGIYDTHHDRRAGTLSLSIDCRAEEHTIRPAFVQDKSAIKVVRAGETRKYLKQDIYGYRDCKGGEYHFFDGKAYELVNPGESIAIYRLYEWRGKQRIARHFFQGDSHGTIRKLTLENLSDEFADEPVFLEKLSLLARNDFQLIRYMHAINRIRMDALRNI